MTDVAGGEGDAVQLFGDPRSKYIERGPGTSQQILITAKGDQMAIVRDADCAELIADGVNVYFAALTEKQNIENELRAKSISGQPAAEKSTDQLRSEAIESDLSTKLLKWLADQNVTRPPGLSACVIA